MFDIIFCLTPGIFIATFTPVWRSRGNRLKNEIIFPLYFVKTNTTPDIASSNFNPFKFMHPFQTMIGLVWLARQKIMYNQ